MIVVDASCIRPGGGMTILNQFIESCSMLCEPITIIVGSEFDETTNSKFVEFIVRPVIGFKERLLWDYSGFSQFLDSLNVVPKLVISFQNTVIRHRFKCPQIVYVHQAIPFERFLWLYLKPKNIKLLFYWMFYKKLIFLYKNTQTNFIVQTKVMKNHVHQSGVERKNILVARPIVCKPEVKNFISKNLGTKIVFFPSSGFDYKNHVEIVKAIRVIKDNNLVEKFTDVKVYFTLSESDNSELVHLINKYDLDDSFFFLEQLSFEQVKNFYIKSNLVVFPSKVETFGLPLVESALLGLPIVASDLPYAHEVLQGYNGVIFAPVDNPHSWATAIAQQLNNQATVEPLEEASLGWQSIIKLIKDKM
ncbi:glycosyltransferase [Pseudomonadota bacterium]